MYLKDKSSLEKVGMYFYIINQIYVYSAFIFFYPKILPTPVSPLLAVFPWCLPCTALVAESLPCGAGAVYSVFHCLVSLGIVRISCGLLSRGFAGWRMLATVHFAILPLLNI